MRSTSARRVLLAVVLAALLAGCGTSSGSDADDAATTPSVAATTTEARGTTTPGSEGSTTTKAEPTTTTEAPSDDAFCASMEDLAASDAKANSLVASGEWPKIKAFYADQTDDILAIYDEAIALDSEITPQLKTLRSVSVSSRDLAQSSSSLMELGGKLASQPGLAATSRATLEASRYVEDTCGFPLLSF